jgi:hypothetical protein
MDILSKEQQQYAADIPGVLERLAYPHIAESGGLMVLLEHKPESFPWQDPMSYHVPGFYPQPINITDNAAEIAQAHYIPVRDALGGREGTADKIEEAGEYLGSGGNIAVITRHDNLTDIAYALKMTDDLLRDQGYQHRSQAIVVSEMLSRIGHMFIFEGTPQEVPAIATLQLLCSDIYKSYPRTKTTKEEINKLPSAKVIEVEIGRRNKEMTDALNEQLDKGGVLLGLAPTGTTKVAVDESGDLKLAPLNDGTVSIMSHPKLRVLRMLVEYEGGAPFAYICGGLVEINTTEDAEGALDVLAKANTKDIKNASDSELLSRFGGLALG